MRPSPTTRLLLALLLTAPATTTAQLATVTPADLYGSPVLTPNREGSLAFAVEWSGGARQLVVRDLRSGRRTTLSRLSPDDVRAAWSSDGQQLVATLRAPGERGIWMLGQEGARRLLLDYVDGVRDIAWSTAPGAPPVLARSSPTGTRIERLADSGRFTPGIDLPVDVTRIAVDADDRGLAFLTATDPARLYAMPDGTPASSRRLGHTLAFDYLSRLAWTPEGDALLVTAREQGDDAVQLWRLPLDGAPPVRVARSADGDLLGFSVSPDRRVFVATYAPEPRVALLELTGRTAGAVRLLSGVGGILPGWAPDGRRLALTRGSWRRQGFPHTLDVALAPLLPGDSLAPPTALIATPREDYTAEWSPDGRWIATHSHVDGADDLFVRSADADRPALVRLSEFGEPAEGGGGDWHPDGDRLVFGAAPRGRGGLYEVRIDRASGAPLAPPRRLALGQLEATLLLGRYAPDGRALAVWARHPDGSAGVYVASQSGDSLSLLARLADPRESYSTPEWSADGSWIYFVASDSAGRWQLHGVPRTGGAVVRLTDDPVGLIHPRRQRAGNTVAAIRWRPPLRIEAVALPPRAAPSGQP